MKLIKLFKKRLISKSTNFIWCLCPFLLWGPIPQSFENTPIICAEPLSDGRFGNHLVGFIEARWIAYRNGLPFFWMPFKYSDQLMLSQYEEKFSFLGPPKNYRKANIENPKVFREFKPESNTIYFVLLPDYLDKELLHEMKSDKNFVTLIRGLIYPKRPESLNIITPPSNMFSVAVQIRKGTGFDPPLKSVQIFNLNYEIDLEPKQGTEFIDKIFPLKFPPEQYYIDQLKRLSSLFCHKKMYVFLFTDDPNIVEIKERIQREVNLPNIRYDYRKTSTGHDVNVLDDFFSMLNFDALIRPGESTLTQAIDLIGNFQIVIYPTAFHWEQDNENREYMIIDAIEVENNFKHQQNPFNSW